ncbi:hypothetical protein FSP39_000769 [Pinctada imbricata]|uniref:Tyrosinase copper-binding domain-containing protein n=1 Tax=Pinctada imbricata TaxID=66713 RepID=A0AA89BVM0_PINIB|nr:hypothetical protein FSP39_000769 [Pinctada imbricata]
MLKFLILVQFINVCFASPGFRLLIPNGINVPNPCPNSFGLWNGVGHNVEVGGGAPNVFGAAFKEANKVWTKELCQADSDTDGKTNGQELGDPNCTWKQGMPYPGDATGHPGPDGQTLILHITMLRLAIFVSLVAVCVSHAGYRLSIPNGINVPNPCPNGFGLWNGVGHNAEVGGGDANVFGAAFKAANHTWTVALCNADSDTDGKTNGEELGDPNCSWKTGMPYPGDATGHPANQTGSVVRRHVYVQPFGSFRQNMLCRYVKSVKFMMKRGLCSLVILFLFVLAEGYIEELRLPDTFSECLFKQKTKNNGTDSYEARNKYCINSHRMKMASAHFTDMNVSQDAVSWINELLRMSNVGMKFNFHYINKRQVLQPIPLNQQNSQNTQQLYQVQFPDQPLIGGSSSQSATNNQIQNAGQPSVNQQISSQSTFNQIPSVPASNQQQAIVPQPQPIVVVQPLSQTANQPAVQPISNAAVPSIPNAVPSIPNAVPLVPNAVPSVQNAVPSVPNVLPSIPNAAVPNIPTPVVRPVPQPAMQAIPPQPAVIQPTVQAPPPPQGIPRPRTLRIRKEIRMMTDRERADFFRAIQMLKADTSIQPNRYDFLGLVHFRMVDNIHHGAAFLPWHRVFITIFENALRQKVPTVTLPYWDSTMDEAMIDSTQSNLWTPEFIGNGNGIVNNGPFAFWQTPNGPLIRNIGNAGGELFSRDAIFSILSRNRMAQITEPAAPDQFNIENYHGNVHTWLGGQMEPMETSAFDPVFYLHHAFVDYVYELFRQRQIAQGIDPTQDYPANYGAETHAPLTPTGFGNLPNAFGMNPLFTSDIYIYQPNPTCSYQNPNCGSRHLTCDISTGVPLCIPIAVGPPRILPPGPGQAGPAEAFGIGPGVPDAGFGGQAPPIFGRKKRQATRSTYPIDSSQFPTCTGTWLSFSSQNTFEIDQVADTRNWVFIPVRIVTKRTPEHRAFNAYPIIDGYAAKKKDIYDPELYQEIKPYFSESVMPASTKCKSITGGRTVGRVHIRSDGMNYQGNYDEYVVVDLRQAFSESITYVALKNPNKGATEVLVSAFDSCGRKCTAYCRDRNKGGYHKCSGALRVNNDTPWEYGKNYGDAVRMSWDLNDMNTIPELQDQSVFIQFYCSHTSE